MAREYEVPEEMKELMLDWMSALNCRNKCITSFFRAKRAIMYGKEAIKAENKFWKMAKSLHPKITKGTWHYSFRDEVIREGDGEE